MSGKRFGKKGWVVVALAVTIAAAVAVSARNLMQWVVSQRISSNESSAIATLRSYLDAQNKFRREDRYGIGKYVFANPRDGTGFPDLYQVRYGTEHARPVLGLMSLSFARAGFAGVPKDGYHFADKQYSDYTLDCGLCAVPTRYGVTGRRAFCIDVTGTVYCADATKCYPDLKHGDPVPPFVDFPVYDDEPRVWYGVAPDQMTGDD